MKRTIVLKQFPDLYGRIPFTRYRILLVQTCLLSHLVLLWDTPVYRLASKLKAVARCRQPVLAIDSMVTGQVDRFASIPSVVRTTVVVTAG